MALAAYINDWLSLLLRWAHIVTGIAWIGASFYFIWLDARLNVPPRNPEHESVGGDLWAVHGGGFYHSQKYRVAPPELPEPLHWFKWEAYFTWITGFALFVVMYYLNADAYLVDPRVMDLGAGAAVAISVGLLLAGVVVYEALCRTVSGERAFTAIGAVAVLATCWGLTQIFSGRGAFMQMGAMLGTIMAANVAHVIIPSQKRLVSAKREGRALDPGARARGEATLRPQQLPDAARRVRDDQPALRVHLRPRRQLGDPVRALRRGCADPALVQPAQSGAQRARSPGARARDPRGRGGRRGAIATPLRWRAFRPDPLGSTCCDLHPGPQRRAATLRPVSFLLADASDDERSRGRRLLRLAARDRSLGAADLRARGRDPHDAAGQRHEHDGRGARCARAVVR